MGRKLKHLSLIFFLFFMTAAAILFFMYFSHDVRLLNDHYPRYRYEKGKISYEFTKDRPRYWVKLGDMSPYFKGALILSEDWGFYQHQGVDLVQLRQALEDIGSKRLRGASTITQQLMKNIYLSHERSLWRKLHEMVLALKVEQHVSKKRILEVYFNSIEFGTGVYGVRQAADHYFGVSASALSPRESAFLAMLLPNPKTYAVSHRKKKLTPFAQKRIRDILQKMRLGKIISPAEYEVALSDSFYWEESN